MFPTLHIYFNEYFKIYKKIILQTFVFVNNKSTDDAVSGIYIVLILVRAGYM